jgi:hypothetical protein
MSSFNPPCVSRPQHFDIRHNRRGYWTARDRSGLIGGTFLTRRDAIRFALFEAGGDAAYVHQAQERRRGGRQ